MAMAMQSGGVRKTRRKQMPVVVAISVVAWGKCVKWFVNNEAKEVRHNRRRQSDEAQA
jgi:hypothetical protein